jgi:hypothetical protein
MPKNSKPTSATATAKEKLSAVQVARIVLGVLLLANLVGVWLNLYPPGGSAEGLQADLTRLQTQLQQAKTRLEASKLHAASVEKGRTTANEFLDHYFVTRRTVPTTLLRELGQIAQRAGIKDPHNGYSPDLIEGSDTLGIITINTSFEGTYKNLLTFVREIDRSDNLFIIDSLSAAPQTNSNALSVAIKMEAFLREDAPPKEGAAAAEIAQGAAP